MNNSKLIDSISEQSNIQQELIIVNPEKDWDELNIIFREGQHGFKVFKYQQDELIFTYCIVFKLDKLISKKLYCNLIRNAMCKCRQCTKYTSLALLALDENLQYFLLKYKN